MAVDHEPVTSFEQWYTGYDPQGERDGKGGYVLGWRDISACAQYYWQEYDFFKREMDARVGNYGVLEKIADNEVISPKPDLPNVSSGETSGLVRRIVRALVQNTPNVEVISCYDDDDVKGLFSRHILTQKIIGSDLYSNDMQQNLYALVKTSFTLGFAAVVPVLLQDAGGGWYMKYDAIHYRDVFPEPGAKDVRDATIVYVRRYLTPGEVRGLIRTNAAGWDVNALKRLLLTRPPAREEQSASQQDKKHKKIPDGYEIITRYDNTGENFLTFSGFGSSQKMLLRIERNKHPLRQHPVHFLILEKDDQQPLGRSQVEPLIGRQDLQDLMLNGAMKLWYRNINPTINIFGDTNSQPNFSPGKYNRIANPNARIEPFEVNTQTLMQYSQITRDNLGSMVNLVGAPDQQMQAAAGHGMSATPQGVEAQAAVVDVTTNNFQKAIEAFFGHYCSYALTVYFQELKATKRVKLTADARQKLLQAGLDTALINEDETLDIDFESMAKEYWVRCIPGSLVEMEDEKQLRILNQLFIPLSQAMPALAATQDPEMIGQAARAMSYIISKQIELSGAAAAHEIGSLWKGGDVEQVNARDAKIAELEAKIEGTSTDTDLMAEAQTETIASLDERVSQLSSNMQLLLEKLGVMNEPSVDSSATPAEVVQPGV